MYVYHTVSLLQDQVYDLEDQLDQIRQELLAQEKEIAEADADDEFKSSVEDVGELFRRWEGLQGVAVQLQPVLQLYTAQLELALGVQEMRQSLIDVGGASGNQRQLEAALEDAKVQYMACIHLFVFVCVCVCVLLSVNNSWAPSSLHEN